MKGTKHANNNLLEMKTKLSTEEVLELIYTNFRRNRNLFEKSEIEELSDIVAKNPQINSSFQKNPECTCYARRPFDLV